MLVKLFVYLILCVVAVFGFALVLYGVASLDDDREPAIFAGILFVLVAFILGLLFIILGVMI